MDTNVQMHLGFIEHRSFIWVSLGSCLTISSFFIFPFLGQNDKLGNFDFIRQRELDYPSDFEGLAKNDNAIG